MKGLDVSNVEVSYIKDDVRPAFVLDDVKGAEFDMVKAQHGSGVPMFRVKNSSDLVLFRCGDLADTRAAKVEKQDY